MLTSEHVALQSQGQVTITVVSESKAGSFNFMMSTASFPSFFTGPFG